MPKVILVFLIVVAYAYIRLEVCGRYVRNKIKNEKDIDKVIRLDYCGIYDKMIRRFWDWRLNKFFEEVK